MLDIVYRSSAIRACGERGSVCVFVYSPTIAARPAGIPLYGIVPENQGPLESGISTNLFAASKT
jgi:hypothetical protein